MKTFVFTLCLLGLVTTLCHAQASGFSIDLISPDRAYLYVDRAWQETAPCLKVKVSVTADISAPALKVYFYDADGKLLHSEKEPTDQSDGRGGMVKPITQFAKGKRYEVYFGVPDAAAKWKRAVVVFGKGTDFAAKVYPKDDLAKFDFPEKKASAQ